MRRPRVRAPPATRLPFSAGLLLTRLLFSPAPSQDGLKALRRLGLFLRRLGLVLGSYSWAPLARFSHVDALVDVGLVR